MAEETEFVIGAAASCSDGPAGEVRRIIIDPADRTVTHLVIEPKRRHEPGRLVPLDLVDTAAGEIRLRCTIAEFGRLDPAEEEDVVEGRSRGLPHPAGRAPAGVPRPVRVTLQDVVPVGEAEVSPGDHVYARDGEIGQVHGFLVDPDANQVTHVLLREGHFWGRKEVAIPVSAVTGAEEGIQLSLTRQQIEDLPPVP
jgi:sporulation protein YlmC with PRC-barrel domain